MLFGVCSIRKKCYKDNRRKKETISYVQRPGRWSFSPPHIIRGQTDATEGSPFVARPNSTNRFDSEYSILPWREFKCLCPSIRPSAWSLVPLIKRDCNCPYLLLGQANRKKSMNLLKAKRWWGESLFFVRQLMRRDTFEGSISCWWYIFESDASDAFRFNAFEEEILHSFVK